VLLQPGHALGVEVVGRLVEQQQVGRLEQQLAQRDAAPGGQRSASMACSMRASSSQPSAFSMTSMSSPCSAISESKSASGSPIAALTSSKRVSASRSGLTASSTLPRTSSSSFSGGSCWSMPTVAPGASTVSPFEAVSRPAMIRSTVDFPAPFGPTTPILAPGRNARVTSSRMTLSPCALRARTME
jgi:hypothetical protein